MKIILVIEMQDTNKTTTTEAQNVDYVPQCFDANAPCSVLSRLIIIIFVVHPMKYKVDFIGRSFI